jgi:hypothetical protein
MDVLQRNLLHEINDDIDLIMQEEFALKKTEPVMEEVSEEIFEPITRMHVSVGAESLGPL